MTRTPYDQFWLASHLVVEMSGDGDGRSIGGRFGDGTYAFVDDRHRTPFAPIGVYGDARSAIDACQTPEDFVVTIGYGPIGRKLWRHGHYPHTANNLPPVEFLEHEDARRAKINRVISNSDPEHHRLFYDRFHPPPPITI